ncbi:hypothetical protein TH53_05620 [Pedobacter lusitanus]|uniref:DUF4136 domain-containing protein n=1 Tax=Pedobacter lusitanus TaxID=1503925 RepID=A0A0D0GUF0_9SPHI|nr:DUF4136 domain-containing protein [Pedobacter lusitanus]KIO78071.1 hypothetical protein TH53_05620 [Pedobacter lusitanus]
MKKLVLVLFAVAAVFSGCSSYNYYSVTRKPLDPAKYKTFAWIPEGKSKSTSIYNNDIATDKIVESASQEMGKRNFVLQNENPDLLLRYTAIVNKEIKEYSDPVYYNPPPRILPRVSYYRGRGVYYYSYYNPLPIYVGERERSIRVKANSIMIDIIDRKTSKVIWRGWAEGEVDNPEKAINEIPEVISNIFKKLS